MKKTVSNRLNSILTVILILLIGLFTVSLFANIQYPLLWNDEADTATFAERILKFGYPKIHDGKNTLYQAQILNKNLITDDKDSYLESDWLKNYFSVPAVLIAKSLQNIYTQTGILRFPHALIGFLGLIIFALSIHNLFRTRIQLLSYLILFTLFEVLSVSLVIHLREMRYYSLLLFLGASIFYFYFRYHIFRNLKYWKYVLSLVTLTLFVLFTFRPVFFVFFAFYTFHGGLLSYRELKRNSFVFDKGTLFRCFKLFLPIFLLVILSIPYLIFFRVFYFIFEQSKYYHFTLQSYFLKISQIISFFWKFELLPLAIFLKIITIFWIKTKKNSKEIDSITKISNILIIFSTVYVLFIARVPYYTFTRYFISLQPILVLIILLDLFRIYRNILDMKKTRRIKNLFVLTSLISLFFIVFITNNKSYITGHIYELTYQYQGPLDYIIPYIKENFKNPENLVIATNYEEQSYMYYLGSKVTIGYVWNNIEEDMKVIPDIIIFRPGWNSNREPFNYFLNKYKYRKILFPVVNYPLNNIPEFDFTFTHQFKTRLATSEKDALTIYVRSDNL